MKIRNKNSIVIAGSLLLGLLLGWFFFSGEKEAAEVHTHDAVVEDISWTCSMHPQVRQPEEGFCPICGMELIPLQEGGPQADPLAVQMSENAVRLANIETVQVGSSQEGTEIRLNGEVTVDERRVSVQTSHVPGRIEELYVNFTGETVTRGEILAEVYSPELVTAQEELLQAYSMKETQPELFRATKEKLRNWKISEKQIDRILERQQASAEFGISADVSGVVTEKLVELGDHVEEGTPIFEIADLSKVWVLFDIYESMSWIKQGDLVEFTVSGFPGETFEGKVAFVDPFLDSRSRVSTARVEVENQDGRLKPGMFVSGIIENSIGSGSSQLTVPKTAVLWTGKRSVVYVRNTDVSQPSFSLREVVLGASVGDAYVVKQGLKKGEEVVVNGTFTVDAAAQLAGKPSMMNPETAGTETIPAGQTDLRSFLSGNTLDFRAEATESFQGWLSELIKNYLKLKSALVVSKGKESRNLANEFLKSLKETDSVSLGKEAGAFWKERVVMLKKAAERIAGTEDLETQRQVFVSLSEEMAKVVTVFGSAGTKLYLDHCPMANSDQGAYWLSNVAQIKNPYYGESMLTCGEIIRELN